MQVAAKPADMAQRSAIMQGFAQQQHQHNLARYGAGDGTHLMRLNSARRAPTKNRAPATICTENRDSSMSRSI